jgi:hypothetical protein
MASDVQRHRANLYVFHSSKFFLEKTITHLYSDPEFKTANQMMFKLAAIKKCKFLRDIACVVFFFLLHRVCATVKIKFQFNIVVTKDTDFVLTLTVSLFILAQAPTFSFRCEFLIKSCKILMRTKLDFSCIFLPAGSCAKPFMALQPGV